VRLFKEGLNDGGGGGFVERFPEADGSIGRSNRLSDMKLWFDGLGWPTPSIRMTPIPGALRVNLAETLFDCEASRD